MLKEKQKLLKNPYSGCVNIGYIQVAIRVGIFEKKKACLPISPSGEVSTMTKFNMLLNKED